MMQRRSAKAPSPFRLLMPNRLPGLALASLVLLVACGPLMAWRATPAMAAPPGTPTVWLDCGHLDHGCLGLSGEFTGDTAAGESLQIRVYDAATDVSTVVTDACRIRDTNGDEPAARVSCMLDAVSAGMVGPMVWEVTRGTTVLWTSEPISVTCETAEDATTTTTAAPPEPADTIPPADTAVANPPPPLPDVPIVDAAQETVAETPIGIVPETLVVKADHTDTVAHALPAVTMASSISGVIEPAVLGTTGSPATVVSGAGGSDGSEALLPETGISTGLLGAAGTVMLAAGCAVLGAGRRWGRPAG